MQFSLRRQEALNTLNILKKQGYLFGINKGYYISWNGNVFLKHQKEFDSEIYQTITVSEVISWKEALRTIKSVNNYIVDWIESLIP